MTNLDGNIFFAIICAVILAWLGGLLIARWYNSKILSYMQSGESPEDQATSNNPKRPLLQQDLPQHPLPSLIRQNSTAIWRYRITIVFISLVLSLMITQFNLKDATPGESFSLTRTTLLLLAHAWPTIPCLGLLERWTRIKIIALSLIYTSFVVILFIFNSGTDSSLAELVIWLYGQQIPPLVFIFFLTGPTIRTLGPYLLLVFFLLISSSLLGYQVLEQSLSENNLDSWIISLAELSNTSFVFILFAILPWAIAFFPLRRLAKGVSSLYQRKLFSEPLYLLSGIWIIILLFQTIVLSHGLGTFAYTLLLAEILIPLFFFLIRPFLKPRHIPPTLLLLRVFREDDGVGRLFDDVLERWRYSGNTVMIAGKDLAIRTLEPDQLFGFLSGHLQDQFIANNAQLEQEINKLDLNVDPDGRYRINEFFCFDSTWKMVLNALISKTNVVLMDLRAYHSKREGCSYELDILANTPHLQKIVILYNTQTDTKMASHLLGDKASQILWVKDMDSKQINLPKTILSALLQ